ncbi:MAG TPA: helix-turn-helix domain-containing protein [Longimicrobium sp.]|nr:helix-turn-helix domain-containing protein [Longimicrobium sp.]
MDAHLRIRNVNGMPAAAPHAVPYSEVAPPPALRDALVCLWGHQEGAAGERAQTVLPDACVDILWVDAGEPVVAGPATRSVIARVAPGTAVVGARFRPGWCAGVLGVDASELRDQHLPLRAVAPALARAFSSEVADRDRLVDKVAVARTLLERYLAHTAPPDEVVRGTVRWLAAHPHGRVHELSRALYLSERQLQRRLLAASGYTPKTLHRILRFQRLLALAGRAGHGDSLATLALRAGYADQAHMTRDLRELAGATPSTLLPDAGSALQMAGLFDVV